MKEDVNLPAQPPLPEKDEAGVIDVESYVPTDILAIQEDKHIQNISLTGGPPDTKIYWSWYDPDDPATNPDIDPNHGLGDDDSISIQFLDVYEENGNYYTITDEQGNTNLRYKIIWKGAWKTFPGDNFQIIGVAGSPNGEDSSISKVIYIVKRMWIEYDYFAFHPEDPTKDPDILSWFNIISELPNLFYSPFFDRNVYLRMERFVDIDEQYEPPEYTPILYEVGNPEEVESTAALLRDSIIKNGAICNYIQLIGATYLINFQGQVWRNILGMSKIRGPAHNGGGIQFGKPRFSFVFTVLIVHPDTPFHGYPPPCSFICYPS